MKQRLINSFKGAMVFVLAPWPLGEPELLLVFRSSLIENVALSSR